MNGTPTPSLSSRWRSLADSSRPSFITFSFLLGSLVVAIGCNSRSEIDREGVTNEEPSSASASQAARDMRAAMKRQDWETANQHAQQALIASPNDPDLITDAARIAALSGRKR
ncbi:MAG: hypothetical protein ACR2NZ_09040, partial [Rubripirellula sp.]